MRSIRPRCSARRSAARRAPSVTPGTSLTTRSTRARDTIDLGKVVPAILMPTGLLMPVASMSMRLRIGGIQTFDSPGRLAPARSSSSTSFSGVIPGRHCSRGLSWIVVSNISSGAGSVAVSARPILPNTRLTSGTRGDQPVGFCRSSARLGRRDARQRRRHVEQIAFVERRQEFAAQARQRECQVTARISECSEDRRLRRSQHDG